MLRFLAVLMLVTACGDSSPASTPTPYLPFLQPPAGTPIAILAPFDSRTGEYAPMNIAQAVPVQAGDVRFAWEPVDGPGDYVLLIQDMGDVSGAVAGDRLSATTYAQLTTNETSTVVLLELEPGTARRLLVFQVFAFDGRDLVGQSDAWALNVRAS